jgi:hypothetical protein
MRKAMVELQLWRLGGGCLTDPEIDGTLDLMRSWKH